MITVLYTVFNIAQIITNRDYNCKRVPGDSFLVYSVQYTEYSISISSRPHSRTSPALLPAGGHAPAATGINSA